MRRSIFNPDTGLERSPVDVPVGTPALLRNQIDLAAISGIDPAQAADWARQMWHALTPIMALRAALRNRGKEA